ncbi:hypothetical protein SUNI508_11813 [Seiridium unicorne]|uniref:Uncharacterized protein n=1 Tax=Seiridium unicorne TaxID=138068 RepID=A0ABR2UGH7_9PEZI
MITDYLEQKPRLLDHDSIDSREPLNLTEPNVGEPDSTSSAALASLLDRTGGRSSMSHHPGERQQFRDKLEEWLDAFTQPGCSVLLLCKGNQEDCHIIPVSIKDSADPSEQWNQARKTWNSRRGMLRSIFHWYRVTSIEMAEITIAGQKSPGHIGEYVGLYQAEDLKSKICELEGQGAEYYNDSFYCVPDTTYEYRHHANECPSTAGEPGPGWECPYTAHDKAQRDLAILKRRPMFKLFFQDPDLARLNLSMGELGLLISHLPERPIDDWVSQEYEAEARLVVGIEYDYLGASEIDKNYQYPVQFAQWTIAAAPKHDVFMNMTDNCLMALHALSAKYNKNLGELHSKDDEVLKATGPVAWTEKVFAAIKARIPEAIRLENLSGMKEPKLFGDILVLPIDGFGEGQSHSGKWAANLNIQSSSEWHSIELLPLGLRDVADIALAVGISHVWEPVLCSKLGDDETNFPGIYAAGTFNIVLTESVIVSQCLLSSLSGKTHPPLVRPAWSPDELYTVYSSTLFADLMTPSPVRARATYHQSALLAPATIYFLQNIPWFLCGTGILGSALFPSGCGPEGSKEALIPPHGLASLQICLNLYLMMCLSGTRSPTLLHVYSRYWHGASNQSWETQNIHKESGIQGLSVKRQGMRPLFLPTSYRGVPGQITHGHVLGLSRTAPQEMFLLGVGTVSRAPWSSNFYLRLYTVSQLLV